jgi:PTH1 family peptidyl-tRNA hydrolase
MPERILIVGLGNPGSAYAANRHNIGFMAIDRIAENHRLGPFRRRFQGETLAAPFAGRDAVFLKPMTYMNVSGQSVAAAARYYKIAVPDIVVFHDEIDLEAGRVRVKRGGGTAGHNGLRSIAAHLGADFRRVRLGVGRPAGRGEVVHHVLRDFAKADADWLEPLLDAVARHAPLLLDGDDSAFMNKVALAVRPPKRQAGERNGPPSVT